jgi:hypothetical protein
MVVKGLYAPLNQSDSENPRPNCKDPRSALVLRLKEGFNRGQSGL